MSEIEVVTVIDATPEQVWAYVEDISTHVDWMLDAEEIRFTSNHQSGLGTTFECDTKVGPILLTDLMEITEWEPNRVMGVRHVGHVTGVGKFTLEPHQGTKTRFVWQEELTFPWFLGGPIGAIAGRPVLIAIWRSNLKRLKAEVERRTC